MRRLFAIVLIALLSVPPSLAKADDAQTFEPQTFVLHKSGHIVAPAEINGKPVYLVVDTGAGRTMIDESAAVLLELQIQDDTQSSAIGAGGAGIKLRSSSGNRFEFAGTTSSEFKFYVMDLKHVVKALTTDEHPIVGVVGSDWLKAHGAVIKYSELTITATK